MEWNSCLPLIHSFDSKRSADLSCRSAAFHARQRSPARFFVASAPHRGWIDRMSRLRRPFLYDRYIFVTVDLLRGRASWRNAISGGWRSLWRGCRKSSGFCLILCYVNPLLSGEAAKRRQTVAHGASRGLARPPLSPYPSPARAGEGCRRRVRAGSPRAWKL